MFVQINRWCYIVKLCSIMHGISTGPNCYQGSRKVIFYMTFQILTENIYERVTFDYNALAVGLLFHRSCIISPETFVGYSNIQLSPELFNFEMQGKLTFI